MKTKIKTGMEKRIIFLNTSLLSVKYITIPNSKYSTTVKKLKRKFAILKLN